MSYPCNRSHLISKLPMVGWIFLGMLLVGMLQHPAGAQPRASSPDSVWMFSYFKGNGEDGLHLAWSRDGYDWKALNNDQPILAPAVGEDSLMRDPNIIQGPDGWFHMVWTVSWHEKGIGYARSKDLVHWSEQQFIPVMEEEEKARNCWAPELFYDDQQDQYLVFWATTIPGRFPETDDTGDNGLNHRIYYTTTKNFETFSAAEMFFNPGFNSIDATIQKAGDRYVMFFKDERRHPVKKNIRLAFSDSAAGPYNHITPPITGDYWAEGPTAARIDGNWVVFFDKYRKGEMGALRSDDLEHWEDISDRLSFPEGVRHGSIFRVSKSLFDRLPWKPKMK